MGDNAHIVRYYDDTPFDDLHDDAGFFGDEYTQRATDEWDQAHWQPYSVAPTWRDRLFWYRQQIGLWTLLAVAFLSSFSLIMLLAVGMAQLTGENDSAPAAAPIPTSIVIGSWPPGVTFAAHTIPAMIRDEIALAGAQHGYQFEGRAGQIWQITVAPEFDSPLDPSIRLYAPSGAELATNDNQDTTSFTAGLLMTLPADGTYRVLVEASPQNPTSTGLYLLTLVKR